MYRDCGQMPTALQVVLQSQCCTTRFRTGPACQALPSNQIKCYNKLVCTRQLQIFTTRQFAAVVNKTPTCIVKVLQPNAADQMVQTQVSKLHRASRLLVHWVLIPAAVPSSRKRYIAYCTKAAHYHVLERYVMTGQLRFKVHGKPSIRSASKA